MYSHHHLPYIGRIYTSVCGHLSYGHKEVAQLLLHSGAQLDIPTNEVYVTRDLHVILITLVSSIQ